MIMTLIANAIKSGGNMAERVLKTRTQFTSTLKNELFLELKEMSEQTDIPISKLLDRAVEQYLENKKNHPSDLY